MHLMCISWDRWYSFALWIFPMKWKLGKLNKFQFVIASSTLVFPTKTIKSFNFHLIPFGFVHFSSCFPYGEMLSILGFLPISECCRHFMKTNSLFCLPHYIVSSFLMCHMLWRFMNNLMLFPRLCC